MAKRKSLGRGLESLLSSPATAAGLKPTSEGELKELPLDVLQRGQYQPRLDMREDALAELAESIRAQGVVQPIVVRPISGGRDTAYEIIAGERRWRAAQMAGLDTIPAVVRDIPDIAAVAVALIENIQREDLNPLEEARALKRLIDEFQVTHGEAAEAVGRSRVAVSNLLRLLELPQEIKDMVERRDLGMGHARALLALSTPVEQVSLARRVARQGLSVRETERLVQAEASRPASRKTTTTQTKDANVKRLERRLGDQLGAPVNIQHGKRGGKVIIGYSSLDELDGILEHIK
jgi:ParB family chromosome partitioning protein